MANHEAFHKIFYPGKPHGIKGQIKDTSPYPFLDNIDQLSTLFILKGNAYIPYFIDHLEVIADDTCFITWEDCSSKEIAMNFCKYELYIAEEEVSTYFDLSDYPFEDWIGYTIIDKEKGTIGKIVAIEEYPGQYMAKVSYGAKEIMIPLADELLEKTDDKKKIVYLQLPEGFLEIFD